MVQYMIKIEGELAKCPGCGRQPRAYHTRGRDQYHLECAPCGLRTAKMGTMQEAVAQWEASETTRMAVRA
jgi:hypothetical protein